MSVAVTAWLVEEFAIDDALRSIDTGRTFELYRTPLHVTMKASKPLSFQR